jgi:putative glycosyltransferase (TIGR04348 family)
MKVLIVTPAPAASRLGNAVTASRYAAIMRSAGWGVRLARSYGEQDVDVLVALHAVKSAESIKRFRRAHPRRPIVVVLTGTDVYRDLRVNRSAWDPLELANAIVTLQPLALRDVPRRLRAKAVSIVQSALCRGGRRSRPAGRGLRVCVVGHLRAEKDPLRAAMAARLLPPSVDVRVLQAGAALDRRFALAARREMRTNHRYRWLGELSRAGTSRLLRNSDVMVLSSLMEGGANVLCEAIACGVPVFASRIAGNVGILGPRYPGLFGVRDTRALARLMQRAALDAVFLRRLRASIERLRPLVRPARERRAWLALLRKLVASSSRRST